MQKITLSMPAQKEHNNGKKNYLLKSGPIYVGSPLFLFWKYISKLPMWESLEFGYKGLLNHHVKKSEWVGNETHKLAIDWQIDKKCNSKVNHSQWVQIISEEASVFFLNKHFLNFWSLIGSLIRWFHELLFNESTNFFNNIFFAIFFLEVEIMIEIKIQRKKNNIMTLYFSKKRHFAALKNMITRAVWFGE